MRQVTRSLVGPAVTRPGPRLTVRAIRPLVSGLSALGHDAERLLGEAGIETRTLENPDAYVPMDVVLSFMAHAVTLTGDDTLGLHGVGA